MSKSKTLSTPLTSSRHTADADTTLALPLNSLHRDYLQAATSDNTRRTYRSAIRHFQRWGGALPCEEKTLLQYLLEHAPTLNSRTLEVRLAALSQWHRTQGFNDPTQSPVVRKTLQGIKRQHGQPKKKATALRVEHIAAMVQHLRQSPPSKKKQRDLALLLLGYFGGFRRSELVALAVEHLHWQPEGLIILLPRSKTDQEGGGLSRAVPKGTEAVCPLQALKVWLDAADITEGVIFKPVNRWDAVQHRALQASAINALLKELGQACAFDFTPDLSSHSLRRGLSTSAAREQVPFEAIKKQGVPWVSQIFLQYNQATGCLSMAFEHFFK